MPGFHTYSAITFGSLAAFLEDTTNGLYAMLANMGWTLYNTIDATAGATERVYRTLGADGTELGFLHIHQTSATVVQMGIGSWMPAAGALPANSENLVEHTAAGKITWAAGPVTAWLAGDEDFVGFVMRQEVQSRTDYGNYGFGFPKRRIPTQWSGRTTLDGDHTITGSGGADTQVEVISSANMTAGQILFFVGYDTVSAKGNILRTTLISVDDGTHITVRSSHVTDTAFDSGALIGLDPMPMCICYTSDTFHGCLADAGACFLYDPATTRLTGTDQLNPTHICVMGMPGYTYGTFYSSNKGPLSGYSDPGDDRILVGYPLVPFGHFDYNGNPVANSDQCRGIISRFMFLPPYGMSFVAGDQLSDGTTTWIAFPTGFGIQYDVYSKWCSLRTVA